MKREKRQFLIENLLLCFFYVALFVGIDIGNQIVMVCLLAALFACSILFGALKRKGKWYNYRDHHAANAYKPFGILLVSSIVIVLMLLLSAFFRSASVYPLILIAMDIVIVSVVFYHLLLDYRSCFPKEKMRMEERSG